MPDMFWPAAVRLKTQTSRRQRVTVQEGRSINLLSFILFLHETSIATTRNPFACRFSGITSLAFRRNWGTKGTTLIAWCPKFGYGYARLQYANRAPESPQRTSQIFLKILKT